MRVPVAPRRHRIGVEAHWGGHAMTVSAGLDPVSGAVIEVFADLPKGGQMAAVVADAAVLVSLCLQHGVSPAALGKSLGREPDLLRGNGATLAASPVGVLADVVADVARDMARLLAEQKSGAEREA